MENLFEQAFTADTALVDTNILVYWFDATDSVRHEKSIRVFDEVNKHPERFVVGLQNIREFCNVLQTKKKLKREEIEMAARAVLDLFRHILADSPSDVEHAVGISDDTKTPYWDALLSATMQRHGIKRIVTEDVKHFQKIPFVKAINPLQ